MVQNPNTANPQQNRYVIVRCCFRESNLPRMAHFSCRKVRLATHSQRHQHDKPPVTSLRNGATRPQQRLVDRCAKEVSDLIHPSDDILPRDVDVLSIDVGERELRTDIAREFSTEFLASADPVATPQWPISGIVYGRYFRVMVELTVKRRNMARRVLFSARHRLSLHVS